MALTKRQPVVQVADDSWKCQGFINIYLNGRKLGAIGLKESKSGDAALLNVLKSDPEVMAEIAKDLTFDFNPVGVEEDVFGLSKYSKKK